MESPYIVSANRLGDVIAAIQAMAVFGFRMRSFEQWAEGISGDAAKASHWKLVFEEHPEFFRLDTTKQMASLVWRRQYPKRYHVGRQEQLTEKEAEMLTPQERLKLARTPLTPVDIKTLIDTAINLHSRAVELRRVNRPGFRGGWLV